MSNESIVVSIEKGEARQQVVRLADVQPGQYFRWSFDDAGVKFRTDTGYVRMNGPSVGEHFAYNAYNHAGSSCILTDRDGNPLTEPVEDTVVVRMTRSAAEKLACDGTGCVLRYAIRDALHADGEQAREALAQRDATVVQSSSPHPQQGGSEEDEDIVALLAVDALVDIYAASDEPMTRGAAALAETVRKYVARWSQKLAARTQEQSE